MKRGSKTKKASAKKKKKEPLAKAQKPIGVWVWAQCDNAGCQKWRKLPPGTVVKDDEPWFCYMNPNEDMNDCSIPEEEYNQLTEAAVYSHPPSKQGHSSDDEDDLESDDDAAWAAKKKPAKQQKQGPPLGPELHLMLGTCRVSPAPARNWPLNDLHTKLEQREENGHSSLAEGRRQSRQRTANKQLGLYQEPATSSEGEDFDRMGEGSDGLRGWQASRGIVKARKTHTGLSKLLARGGVWEITKGKGKAVTAPPTWVWEGLATHAPESAELACRAVDASSAARYFEIAQAPMGPQQASSAADNARLSLTAAAALAVQETSQIPGINDSPQSGSSDPAPFHNDGGESQAELDVPALASAAPDLAQAWQEGQLSAGPGQGDQALEPTPEARPQQTVLPDQPGPSGGVQPAPALEITPQKIALPESMPPPTASADSGQANPSGPVLDHISPAAAEYA